MEGKVMDAGLTFEHAALITIDTQNDTLDGQPLEVPGTSAVLPNIVELCRVFRSSGRPIVHIVRLYRADASNVDPCRRELVLEGTPILRPGTPGRSPAPGLVPADAAELDDDLLLAGGLQRLGDNEVVMYKPRWGAFYDTPLEAHLRSLVVDTLVFAGCNFPNCPRASIYEASERDFQVVVIEDAISGLYDRGLDELRNIGVRVLSTTEVVRGRGATAPRS
jgi:nicotinamidase-related amidase